MFDRTTGSTFERGAYWSLLVVFNGFVAVSWMPRITTIGDSDIGIGAVLLALMVPLFLVLPKQPALDNQARHTGIAMLAMIGFVIFWGYLGMYRLDSPMRAGRLLLSLGQGIILILVITQSLSPRAIRFSLGVSFFMLVVVSLMSLYGYLGGQPVTLTYRQRDRSSGLFKNPNQYGMIASMAVPFAAAYFFQYKEKLFASVLMLAAWLALLMAASKTNMFISLLIMIVTLSYGLLSAKRGASLLIVLPVLTGLIWFCGLPILEFFNPRAAGILQSLLQQDSGSANTIDQRFELWSYSYDVMRNSPWFGEGTGQLIDVVTQKHSHSHNVFLDLGRTVGIPGLIGSLIFILIGCWLAVKTLARVSTIPSHLGNYLNGRAIVVGAAFAVLSYVLSNQMSDSLGPSTSVFLWLCLGLLLRRHDIVFDEPTSHAKSGRSINERVASA